MELYKKERPKKLERVVGQPAAVKALQHFIKTDTVPHVIGFFGHTGAGKTTLARILVDILECNKDTCYTEINCSDFRGIDMVREIRSKLRLACPGSKCRIWLIEEAHKLTDEAQNAFLFILENLPPHVYIFICTTDPDELISPFRGRCSPIEIKKMPIKAMEEVLQRIATKKEFALSEDVCDKIIEASDGSMRLAIQILETILGIDTEEEQIAAITLSNKAKETLGDLFKLLMNPRAQWSEVAKLLKGIKEEPEKVRHYILACCRNVMLAGNRGSGRAWDIYSVFKDNWYDCKVAGLVGSCFDICCPGKK